MSDVVLNKTRFRSGSTRSTALQITLRTWAGQNFRAVAHRRQDIGRMDELPGASVIGA